MSSPLVALLHHRPGLPWIFEAAKRVGCDLLLVPRPGEDVQPRELPSSVVDVLHLDGVGEPGTALATLAVYHRRHPLSGLITMWDPAVPFTARAAAELHLPGLPVEAARRVTDKAAVRRAMREVGANSPEYVDGPEYAVESFVYAGTTYVLSIGYKGQPVGPYFEEGVYRVPAGLPEKVRAAIVHVVALVNRAGRHRPRSGPHRIAAR